MTELLSLHFWEDVLQWCLIGYLLLRTQKKPRKDPDMGTVESHKTFRGLP
jgi:hypothetical protein